MTETTKETVACAAIRGTRAITFAGKRHHNCLQQITSAGFGGLWKCNSEQGFMTTHGRFVSREDGRKLQDAAGIPSADPGGYRGTNTLYSEDLY